MVLVSLVFWAKCVYDDDDGDVYVLLCLKEKNPDIRCISAPGSVMGINMSRVVSRFFIAPRLFSLHHQRFCQHGVAVAYPHHVVSSLETLMLESPRVIDQASGIFISIPDVPLLCPVLLNPH